MCKNIKWWHRTVIPFILFMAFIQNASAQDFSIKSNLLYDATGTVNLGIEAPVARQWTFDLSGNLNAWRFTETSVWKHYMIQPEFRYWLCNRFSGHWFGFHAHGGQYNVGGISNSLSFLGTDFSVLTDRRYQGWFIGCGLSYGYAVPLGVHWNLDLGLGLGYSYTMSDVYECQECGKHIHAGLPHHYLGITKLAVSLAYLF